MTFLSSKETKNNKLILNLYYVNNILKYSISIMMKNIDSWKMLLLKNNSTVFLYYRRNDGKVKNYFSFTQRQNPPNNIYSFCLRRIIAVNKKLIIEVSFHRYYN